MSIRRKKYAMFRAGMESLLKHSIALFASAITMKLGDWICYKGLFSIAVFQFDLTTTTEVYEKIVTLCLCKVYH